ncbi:cupin domain-containing protein [Streptacidiphilus rugosus]|uniref:cupin domain-containing protein n=1 Tax=Streptacidiphilus rugosus TaxID=405783 RepID=UPI000563B75B|nr:cupin domain-containing protein [Streptacidiphilus rugosus]
MTDDASAEDGDTTGPVPSLLCDVQALTAGLGPDGAGAVWKLAESGRQLDANLVHLQAGRQVGTHTEPDLDVLLLVVAGSGVLTSPGGAERLTAGSLYWLPRGSTRALTAGDAGLSWLTVHRRRPGLQIRPGPRPEAPA